MTYDDNIARINLRASLDALCISLACIMAGSGDLDVLRRLRVLHGRRHDEANYGAHMAAHMAIGLLFMGAGQFTLGTSPLATAALFCATYPKFPSTPSDNHFHLQALRHLWTLAVERRCLIPRSVDTFQPTLVPIKVFLRSTSDVAGPGLDLTAPCLLPEFSTIHSIETASAAFQPVVLDFSTRNELLERLKRDPTIFVAPSPINAAYRTSFEQGLARLVKQGTERLQRKSSIPRLVQDSLQTSYIEEEPETSEGRVLWLSS
jgi:anaphase-promoting complex subunit 1